MGFIPEVSAKLKEPARFSINDLSVRVITL